MGRNIKVIKIGEKEMNITWQTAGIMFRGLEHVKSDGHHDFKSNKHPNLRLSAG